MKSSIRTLCSAFLIAACINHAAAEELKVEVVVPARFAPVTAVGILVTPEGTYRLPVADPAHSVRRRNDQEIIVPFSVDASIIRADTYAGALAVSAEGESAFGNMKRLSPKAPEQNLVKAVPLCPVKNINDAVLAAKASEVKQLVQLRLEKRELVRKMISDALTEEVAKRLQNLEGMLGLAYGSPFSSTLPAEELSIRLERINNALQNMDYHKQFQITPSPAAPQDEGVK